MSTPSRLDRLTTTIQNGSIALGVVVTSAAPATTEILATCGYDFVWIDMEHTTIGKAEVDRHIVAARSRGLAPLVRVPWNDPVLAKPILEMGPAGLVFPFVNSAEDAARAVAACRYPPFGTRGFGPLRSNDFGSTGLAAYLERAKSEPWVVVQIEHVDAVRNLGAICSVPGVDSLLVGPFDLSASVGKPGQTADPAVLEMMDEIARVARERRMILGAFCLSTDTLAIQQWISRGASWLALDTDAGLLARAARESIDTVRRLESADRR